MFVCRASARNTPLALLRKALSTDAAHNLPRHASRRLFAAQVEGAEEDTRASSSPAEGARKSLAPLERKVRQHLQWLSDPFKFQELVQSKLAKDEYEETALLVRRGSKDFQLTVSWNYLIQYLMRKGKLHSAIDLFNDMKKRAQLPDAQTYNIIFNGCATNPHAKSAVAMATRIYQTMINNDRIPPSTIHMNTVLKVCSRAKDLDSLFLIAATANETTRIPDTWTYTIILNALRYGVLEPQRVQRRDGNPTNVRIVVDERQAQVAVARANAIWEEVLTRWRRGLVTMDDFLVCAMGRVLHIVENPSVSHVLALIEQTMNIPRLDRHAPGQVGDGRESAVTDAAPTEGLEPLQPPPAISPGILPKPSTYAQPSKQSLSLVMSSLEKTRKTSLGIKYWEIFTARGVVPDADNWFRLLRVFRCGHASAQTATMLQHMPKAFLEPRTFRMAMESCASDSRNDSAFAHATTILDVMKKSLACPDPQTLLVYLKVVMASAKRVFHAQMATNDDIRGAKHAMGVQMLRGLDRLWESLRLVTNSLSFRAVGRRSEGEAWANSVAQREEVYALARGMMSAMDQVVTEGMVEGKILTVVKVRKGVLGRQILRLSEQMKMKNLPQRLEPGRRRDGPRVLRAEQKDIIETRRDSQDLFKETYDEARTTSQEDRVLPSF